MSSVRRRHTFQTDGRDKPSRPSVGFFSDILVHIIDEPADMNMPQTDEEEIMEVVQHWNQLTLRIAASEVRGSTISSPSSF